MKSRVSLSLGLKSILAKAKCEAIYLVTLFASLRGDLNSNAIILNLNSASVTLVSVVSASLKPCRKCRYDKCISGGMKPELVAFIEISEPALLKGCCINDVSLYEYQIARSSMHFIIKKFECLCRTG